MAITFQQQHDLATDMNFVNRVRQAGLTVALEVLAESGGDYELYQARAGLATRLMNDPLNQSKRLAYILATASPSADQSTINDTALLTFVRGKWTLLAAYNPNAPEPPETP